MTSAIAGDAQARHQEFRHEALLYAGSREFLEGTLRFLREGLANDEPALVVVDTSKIDALRAALGADTERVQFADMAQVGRNPARIIHRWRRFVDDHLRYDRPVRGIGEPIWAGRGPAELAECQAHELLLNVAFAGSPAWSLLCPYDIEALEPAVVEEARRSHPYLMRNGTREVSADYTIAEPVPVQRTQTLPPPPADAEQIRFGPDPQSLRMVRELVLDHAARAGAGPTTMENVVLAVNEVATNSLVHGGGQGTLRVWGEGDALVCQVDDHGRITGQPLVGRLAPEVLQDGGRGLWMVNQLCDLVQIRSSAAGTTVRLRISRSGGPASP